MIAIVDYGMGNPGSIKNMLHKLGVAAQISSDPGIIDSAEKLILPGVGAFDAGMQNLRDRGLVPLLNRRVLDEHVPILGVCLGMQLMTAASGEGRETGLSWINAKATQFVVPANSNLKVPHMGWAPIHVSKASNLFPDDRSDLRYYFVHSYHVSCEDADDVLCEADYGYKFVAGFERGNILGVQFHPEKSHKFGLMLYDNFIKRY